MCDSVSRNWAYLFEEYVFINIQYLTFLILHAESTADLGGNKAQAPVFVSFYL